MQNPLAILTRRPGPRLADGELTFLQRAMPDLELAAKQHQDYRHALSAHAPIIDVPAHSDFPDAVFVEDAILALPECFVLCRSAAASRVGEVESLKPFLPQDRPQFAIEAPASLDGGDVLLIERRLFVGMSSRTNHAAIQRLRALLTQFDYEVIPVAVHGALHLKTAVTALDAGTLFANRAWVDVAAFGAMRCLDVCPEEPFAGNTLRIGGTRWVQSAHVKTATLLRDAGFAVETLDISEFAKLEAGLTCMSVQIPLPA
jgi:dimethylargininase